MPAPKALGKGVAAAKLAKQVFVDGGTSEYDAIKPDGDANELKSDTWTKLNGWYLDLPAAGERLLKGMVLRCQQLADCLVTSACQGVDWHQQRRELRRHLC